MVKRLVIVMWYGSVCGGFYGVVEEGGGERSGCSKNGSSSSVAA